MSGIKLKSSGSPFFTYSDDSAFKFELAADPDPVLGPFGTFTLTTLEGTSKAKIFTPSSDLTAFKSLDPPTTFNFKDVSVLKTALTGEIVINSKAKKVTLTLYAGDALVGGYVGNIAAGLSDNTRVAAFVWND